MSCEMPSESMRDAVRAKYAAIARGESDSCGSSSCGSTSTSGPSTDVVGDAYADVDGYVDEADLQLGCGAPTEHADLDAGQTVVDLGSGAGLDAFVARRFVGESGRVIGVDFVPEMVEKARANVEEMGYANVTFVVGAIEDLPLYAQTADVVLSNCVLNLVPDKAQAFEEMHRILRPGGHFCVSDIVSHGSLPDAVRQSAELYVGCVAGAMDETDYLERLRATGFVDIDVPVRRRIEIPDDALPKTGSDSSETSLANGGLWSVTVRGTKPAT